MAPLKNIVYTLHQKWPERKIYLFFGARKTGDVFYLDIYNELKKEHSNLEIIFALSDPLETDEKWDGETGFIHLSVDKHLKPEGKKQAFLCGPPPMIEAVMDVLEEKGIKTEDIFYDKF